MLKAFFLAVAGMIALGCGTMASEPGLQQLIYFLGLGLVAGACFIIIHIDKNKDKRL